MNRLLHDLRSLFEWVCIVIAWGVIANALRESPLPWTYLNPKDRIRASMLQSTNGMPSKSGAPSPSAHSDTAGIREIRLDEVKSLLNQPGTILLDVRSATHYKKGHIPGAYNLPRENFAEVLPQIFPLLSAPDARSIVVYCSGPNCEDSRVVAELLVEMKFPSVRLFQGGWEQWETSAMTPAAPRR